MEAHISFNSRHLGAGTKGVSRDRAAPPRRREERRHPPVAAFPRGATGTAKDAARGHCCNGT